jgi:hypothetical protein
MRNGIAPAVISEFRQYVLARAHGFDEIADLKENFVIASFDRFCATELAELCRRCSITNINAGAIIERLATRWRAIPVPRPQPTLNEVAPVMQGWQPLSGKIVTSPVTAIVTTVYHGVVVDIFFRDVSTLCHSRWKAGSWSEWQSSCEVKGISQQSVVQYNSSYLSIYGLEANGKCKEMYFNLTGGDWEGNNSLDGTVISAPSASCNFTHTPSVARTDLFALGTKNECMHNCWTKDTSNWSGWKSLGGVMISQPVAVWTTEPHQLHVFALNPLHNICHTWWDGNSWKAWENLGGRFISKPTVVAQAPNLLHIFAVCTERSTWHRWWNGTSWTTSWEHLTEKSVSIQCVCVNPNRLDIFVVGIDGVCRRRMRNGVLWTDWQHISGLFVSEMSVVYIPAPHNQILLVGVGADSVCWYKILQ